MPDEQRRSAQASRLGAGALGIIIGVILLFKGSLASYLPLVGVFFILAGLVIIVLAFVYARRSQP